MYHLSWAKRIRILLEFWFPVGHVWKKHYWLRLHKCAYYLHSWFTVALGVNTLGVGYVKCEDLGTGEQMKDIGDQKKLSIFFIKYLAFNNYNKTGSHLWEEFADH